MPRPQASVRLASCLLVVGLLGMLSGRGARAASPPLTEVQLVALAGVERRIDHFAVDPTGNRLFVAALGNGTLEVLDIAARKRVTSIPGLKEPQGIAYLPSVHRIVVAMRGGGVKAFDDHDYRVMTTMSGMKDADNLRFDAANGQLYVGYGEGSLAVIDPASMTRIADIALPGHPESFRLEDMHGSRCDGRRGAVQRIPRTLRLGRPTARGPIAVQRFDGTVHRLPPPRRPLRRPR